MPEPSSDTILIATDNVADADQVRRFPVEEFDKIFAMAIHHALSEVAVGDSGPSAAEFAFQARRLEQLESLLEHSVAVWRRCQTYTGAQRPGGSRAREAWRYGSSDLNGFPK